MAQTILITGTNSGFGRLTALTLARAAQSVWHYSRREWQKQGRCGVTRRARRRQHQGARSGFDGRRIDQHAVQQALAEGPIDVL